MSRVYYQLHIHSSGGEKDIIASVVEDLDHGFIRIEEKNSGKQYVVYRSKLGKRLEQKVRKK